MLKRILFLDLEDTLTTPIVNGMANCHLVNLEKVRSLASEFSPDEVHLFSFAIHSDFDQRAFNVILRNWLEEQFKLKFSFEVPLKASDLIEKAAINKKLMPSLVSFEDACEFWGKDLCFKLFVKETLRNCEVLLLDDCVDNESFEFKDINVKGSMIKID